MPNILEDVGLGIALLGLLIITIQGGRGGKEQLEELAKEEAKKEEERKKKELKDKMDELKM